MNNVEIQDVGAPTREELRQIMALSSRDFDNLFCQAPEKMRLRYLIAKGVQYFEEQLRSVEQELPGDRETRKNNTDSQKPNSNNNNNNNNSNKNKNNNHNNNDNNHINKNDTNGSTDNVQGENSVSIASTFRRLGHLHLIAQDYPKALSAYQLCYELDDDCWQDADFMFGLGLVHFHFNEYKCVISVFQKLLYVHPNFERCGDVFVRLGLSFKGLENWELAIKYLNSALTDPMPTPFSTLEIRFQIAHCYDQQGQPKKAKDAYDALLQLTDVPPVLRASVLRQLGWLFFRTEELGEKNSRLSSAITYLNESLRLDPANGKTHYFLGRCYSAIGRAHDAFVAYRQSIDKTESSADTWCSIGVLYQQQQQPMDALQAFVCAVQLDERHYAAWVDLGLLYEQCGQPADALSCYKNATKCRPGVEALTERIRVLESQLKAHHSQQTSATDGQQTTVANQSAKGVSSTSGKRNAIPLPSLSEAWNLPIPAELTSRQSAAQQKKFVSYLRGSLIGIGTQDLCQQQRLMNENAYTQIVPAQQAQAPVVAGELPQVSQEDLQALLGDDREMKYDQNLGSDAEKLLQDNEVTSTTAQDVSAPPPLNLMAHCNVPLTITSQQLREKCRLRLTSGYVPVVDERTPPPKPEAPSTPPLSKEQLILPTPTVVIDSKKDAQAVELQMFCYQRDVAVLRNFASALRLDLGLFSSKSLMETAGDQQVEVRTQFMMSPDKNITPAGDKSWYCGSTRSFTTVAKYAQYQAQSFQQSLRDEQEKTKNGRKSPELENSVILTNGNKRRREDVNGNLKVIKFGTNVDLSDDKRWKTQLQELQKMPSFCRVASSSNLLSHLNHVVLGMNTVQLYMKVPGSRTPGHQENNNFASININIGPGECEWFAVPYKYWPLIQELCEKNGVDYLKGSWWPPLEDLHELNVPVYRFTQKAGDMVWVMSGTVHWVQATGWCNNIAWNVGPFMTTQMDMALERYEWNKLQSYKSIVPLVHLCWQLARNVKFSDEGLYERVRMVLLRSLAHCYMSTDFITVKLGKELRYQPREEGEPAHYCTICEVEVFNILYVREQERKFVVHCLPCALRVDRELKSFTVLNQYSIDELSTLYDLFTVIEKKTGAVC